MGPKVRSRRKTLTTSSRIHRADFLSVPHGILYCYLKQKRNQDSEKENQTDAKIVAQPPTAAKDEDDDGDIAPNNNALADAMKELGKLHQKCPLNDDDTWKAYALNKIAGRIRRLPFQVTLERESQLRLKSIYGLGTSTLEKINQFLQTGYIERTKEFQRDPERKAMKQMMGIWGVGRKTVRVVMYCFLVFAASFHFFFFFRKGSC